jgi:hypothetical protein
MKKLLVVLLVLLGVFLAIGCAGNQNESQAPAGTPGEAGTPEQAVTAVEVVTGKETVTPVQEVVAVTETVQQTPVQAVTPAERSGRNISIGGDNRSIQRTVVKDENGTHIVTNITGERGTISRTKTVGNTS